MSTAGKELPSSHRGSAAQIGLPLVELLVALGEAGIASGVDASFDLDRFIEETPAGA